MSDEILKAVNGLRDKVNEMDIKLETMNTKLVPVNNLIQGDGRPSLDARLFHLEKEIEQQQASTTWAYRTAAAAVLSAVGSIIVSFIK
mgnify:CR=1 FL=1|tara:strand:+ start:3662 stop:3925 length:264 start_codon:yes stop_codon:yes gene_type:complete